MAKLYWRIKKNGKWTWVALDDENTHQVDNLLLYMNGDWSVETVNESTFQLNSVLEIGAQCSVLATPLYVPRQM